MKITLLLSALALAIAGILHPVYASGETYSFSAHGSPIAAAILISGLTIYKTR